MLLKFLNCTLNYIFLINLINGQEAQLSNYQMITKILKMNNDFWHEMKQLLEGEINQILLTFHLMVAPTKWLNMLPGLE